MLSNIVQKHLIHMQFLTKKFWFIFICQAKEFADDYALSSEKEFSSNSGAESLLMHDNDPDKVWVVKTIQLELLFILGMLDIPLLS